MAAYAALTSLTHIIEQIQHHPLPPISLDVIQVQSLTEKVTFLKDFVEVYSHVCKEEAGGLQSRIADAAYETEDVIESHIVDQILVRSTTDEERISSTVDFYQGLQKVIQNMDLIRKEVMEIQEKMGSVQDIHLHTSSSIPIPGSSRSPSKGQNIIVGLDDALEEVMDKLTRRQSNRQIIPIVGMGGIGKTTVAKNAYENPLIVQHFDIRVWATISQEYGVKEILLQCLGQDSPQILSQMGKEELGERLHKKLWGRRYLMIMDDVWSIEAWDKVKLFFPDNKNGSKIIITSRFSNLALQICGNCGLEMNFLNEELGWNLLCKIVFGVEDGFPLELEKVGRTIVRNCKGLPLSIVVIGGLLTKSEKTREYWEYIAENLNSIVNLEDNERCFKLLYMSYNYLPLHLKPCFLYMGVFREDREIFASNIIKLWVAEGFLKPIIGKSFEEVAEQYLNELIDRNLILVLKWKSNGKIKLCKMHDLLRDLCLREAHKEKFLCVAKLCSSPERTKIQRRTAIHENTWKEENKYYLPQIHDAFQTASLARSLICDVSEIIVPNFRLLRVFKGKAIESVDTFFHRVNLRYLVLNYSSEMFRVDLDLSKILPSVNLLWNLQTLILSDFVCTIDIWKMPLLRHVKLYRLCFPDPSSGFSSYCLGMFDEQDDFVLGTCRRSRML